MTNSLFNLSDLDDTKGFALKGINAYDGSGSSVSGAAVDKVTITLPDSHFQLFDTLSPTEISLLSGFAINGIDIGDASGFSVSGAGDINGDGIDDLIIGAKYASPNGNDRAGESYVIFGSDQGFTSSLDLSALDGSNGFVINGIRGRDSMFESSGDASGFSVSSAGDINGDGIDDLIIGAPYADLNGSQVGESYVVFGSDQGFTASLDLSSLNGSNGFVINDINNIEASSDNTGFSVSGAGDINGDGFDDLIIGAPYADAYISYTRAGKSYVIFGSEQSLSARFDLSALDGNNGFAINGIDIGDESGFSVSGAGDINGDGFDDLIIGAPIAKPNSVNQAGESYVVFGSDQGFGANLDLATLNGNNGFVIEGAYSSGLLGWSVSGAGDIDGDGFDDLIIGARRGANPNGNWSTGEIYVIFGKSGNFKSNLNITDLNGTNGFIIYGINSFDYAGWSVSDAGDVNGDGFDDLIIGAPQAPINPEGQSQSYVVFGKANGFLPHFNLSDLDGNKGFVINGIDGGDRSGSSVSGAGDINNDGFDDLIIGAPSADPNGIIYAGESYVVFGRSQFTASLDLANLSSKTANVFENSPNGTIIADLRTNDPDEEDNHTYTLLNNAGGRFAIEGNQLIVADGSLLDFESNDTHKIEIQTTDNAGLSFSQSFTITVIDVNENPEPTGIILSDSTILENSPNNIVIGNLSTIDPSEGDDSHTYTLLDSAGGRFALEGNQLIVADGSLLDFESNDSHVIEIQTTDSTGLSFSQSFTIIVIDDVNEAKAPTRISLLQGFVINGIDSEDVSGKTVSGAGDINGDGFADLIIGAENGDPNRKKNAGEAYVVFGFNQNFSESFDLSDLDGRNGFIVEGLNSFDFLGGSVSRAGDINGDGFADIIIGATGADPNGSNAGSAYVIFGSNQEFLASFDLSDLNGSNGFIITGLESFNLGSSVSDAGDINGDGFDDLIVGAPSATPNDNYRAGTSYVIFGSDQGFAANLDVATLNGRNGFVINGIATSGGLGETVSSAGDINGDGLDDLILGAFSVDLDGKSGAGESYVIFGSNQDFAASLDLSTLNGSNGFVIKGIDAGDFSGYSVSNAGDINGDGIDDLIIGAREADPNGKDGAGESYLVFGSNQRFPAILDLSTLNGSNGFVINGINSGDRSSRPVSNAGDINGDGIDDLIIGASDADPNGESYAGESYVIFGSNQSFPASFELSALNGSNGFIIKGIDSFDKSGYSVSAAGDINGDGFDELIIGAYSANPNSVNQAGESYVVFGRSQFTMSLELANLSSNTANVFENSPNGTIIADLSTNDPNTRDTHTYTILDSAEGRFAIEGNQLIVADGDLLDFESNTSHEIEIQTTDKAGLSVSQTFTIVVFDVPDLEIGLYDTDSDTLITPIKNDDVISASILPNGNVTIAAFVPEDSRFFGDVESIFLDLNQGDVTRTENVEPYALFGDLPPGDFKAGSSIPLGDNSISFKLYSGDGLSGDFLGTVTLSFSIVEDLDIGLYDADSDELITPLNEGDELLASTLEGRNVTIAAFVPEDSLFFSQVESMRLNLNDGEVIRTENIEPYSLFGDANGNYHRGSLPFGDNRIAFELYPENNLQGNLLDTVTRNFTITNDL